MNITKQQLKQIIKEELESVLMEKNFDSETGYPISLAGVEMALKNQKMLDRFEKLGPNFVKVLKMVQRDRDILPDDEQEEFLRQMSDDILDRAKRKKEIDDLNTRTEKANQQLVDDKEKYEQMLKKNWNDFSSREQAMFDKFINANLETKKKFISDIQANGGDEAYRKKFPNWDEMKEMALKNIEITIDGLKKQKEISRKSMKEAKGKKG
jgi:hypothetical protein